MLSIVLLLNRIALGIFFVLARFRWIYDPSKPGYRPPYREISYKGRVAEWVNERPEQKSERWFNTERHKHLVWKLGTCHYPKWPFLAGIVALTELAGGLGVLTGMFTQIAALGLLITLLFATICTAKDKVLEQHPVDWIDCVSDYFWRVEILYIILALGLVLLGAGEYSLDQILGVNEWITTILNIH